MNGYLNIEEHIYNKNDLFSNAWFTGFIDADGSFDVRLRSNGRAEVRFRIEQRILDPLTKESYFSSFYFIANSLNVKLNKSIHHGKEYYIIAVTSPLKLVNLCNYLSEGQFPLLTIKYLNFVDFKKSHQMMLNKEHLTLKGKEEIKIIRNNINSKRKNITWDHINLLKENLS